jgi:hypothetical protein
MNLSMQVFVKVCPLFMTTTLGIVFQVLPWTNYLFRHSADLDQATIRNTDLLMTARANARYILSHE